MEQIGELFRKEWTNLEMFGRRGQGRPDFEPSRREYFLPYEEYVDVDRLEMPNDVFNRILQVMGRPWRFCDY